MVLQPEGERIAFHLVDSTTEWVLEMSIPLKWEKSCFWTDGYRVRKGGSNWNLDGTKLVFTAGGSLIVAGADLSGPNVLDSAVVSTPAAPVELQPSQYGYAGKKTQVRLTTVVGADEVVKDDLPFEFSAEIEGFSGARRTNYLLWQER